MWNLDSLRARDYARIPLIDSFQAEYKLDMFGVVESALTANVSKDSILVEDFCPVPLRGGFTVCGPWAFLIMRGPF